MALRIKRNLGREISISGVRQIIIIICVTRVQKDF